MPSLMDQIEAAPAVEFVEPSSDRPADRNVEGGQEKSDYQLLAEEIMRPAKEKRDAYLAGISSRSGSDEALGQAMSDAAVNSLMHLPDKGTIDWIPIERMPDDGRAVLGFFPPYTDPETETEYERLTVEIKWLVYDAGTVDEWAGVVYALEEMRDLYGSPDPTRQYPTHFAYINTPE